MKRIILTFIITLFFIGWDANTEAIAQSQTSNQRKGLLNIMNPNKGTKKSMGLFQKKKKVTPKSTPPKNWHKKPLSNSLRNKYFNESVYDYGLRVGAINALTDIGGNTSSGQTFIMDVQLQKTRYSLGGFARMPVNSIMKMNASLDFVRLAGDDSLSEYKELRNRSFVNNIYQLSIKAEFFRPQKRIYSRRLSADFDYYAFAGVSAFYHKPEGTGPSVASDNYFLLNDSEFSFGIPIGAGFYFTMPSNWRIGLDVTWHKTFTDYLDGITTVWSKGNDGYVQTALSVSYLVKAKKRYAAYRR